MALQSAGAHTQAVKKTQIHKHKHNLTNKQKKMIKSHQHHARTNTRNMLISMYKVLHFHIHARAHMNVICKLNHKGSKLNMHTPAWTYT